MKTGQGIPHITMGAVLFLVGGYLAYSFYNYDIGKTTTTLWIDVIIFSVISLLGLFILIYGIRKILTKQKND